VFLKAGAAYLELFRTADVHPAGAPRGDGYAFQGVRHLAFMVDDVDAKLRDMGPDAKVTASPMAVDAFIPGWKTAWLAEPEGSIVEISQGYADEPNPPALA
jgi:glyoxylase I family protein